MTVISSKEFITNQSKYFSLAQSEDIFIKRGNNVFQLIRTNTYNTDEYDEILEPDDDFRRAITMDELLNGVLEDIHNFYVNK